MPAGWWLYVVETAQGRLYTGITTDVDRRFQEHCHGKRGARALRGKGPLSLRFRCPAGGHSQALRLEYVFKQQKRAQKLAFIEGHRSIDELIPADA